MVVKTDAPYAGGLAALVGKPAAGVVALVHAFLNNQATVEGSPTADIPLLNPEAEAPENSPLLPLVASALEYVVAMNEQLQDGSSCSGAQDAQEQLSGAGAVQLTVFHGQRAPPISILDYLVRMAKYTKCSPACFVHAMVHLMRAAEMAPGYRPTSLNVHRLLLTAVLLSAKFLDDRYFNNAFYAKVGGVSTQELNRLEMEMLSLLEFRLLVTPEQVVQLMAALQLGQLGTMLLAAGFVAFAPALPACALLGINDVLGGLALGAAAAGGSGGGVSAFGSSPAAGGGARWMDMAVDTAPAPGGGGVAAAHHGPLCGGGPAASQRKRRSNSLEMCEPDCRPRCMVARRSMEMVVAMV